MAPSSGRLCFSAFCVVSIVLAGVYPSWATNHQLQGYGGYVDMAVQALSLPSEAVAGSAVSLQLRVSNLGPETADSPQVVFSADPGFVLSATDGCLNSPLAGPRCGLAPLAAGEFRDLTFSGRLQPDARGVSTVGAFALSEAIDVQAGNEMLVAAIALRTRVDLIVQLEDPRPTTTADGRLNWVFQVVNAGASTATQAVLSTNTQPWGEGMVTCEPIDANAVCMNALGGATIAPGSGLRFRVSLPPLSASTPAVSAWLSAHPYSEEEVNPGDNTLFFAYEDVLLQADFEY